MQSARVTPNPALRRVQLAVFGAAAALALWALGDNAVGSGLAPLLYLALFTFVAVQGTVTLALAGPVPVGRALEGALLVSLPLTALACLAGQRHVNPADLLDDPVMLSVAAVLTVVSTPFVAVWLQDRARWRSYVPLFESAWAMVARYVVAVSFVALVWLVLVLSDSLLQLVDIAVIGRMAATGWAGFALSGAALGLAMATLHDLRGAISAHPVLRLLRLLVPVMLAVVTIFLLAVALRGLSRLFGDLSSAATLMGAAIVAITLISAAVEKDDAAAARGMVRGAARLLAMLLAPLAALALWAVMLRVAQYGWTPNRILASAVAGFLCAYALGYGGAVLGRRGWAGRIRGVNTAMALAVIAGGVLWMTPLLDVYRLSTASQLARFVAGASTLEQLPLWHLQHDWGRAGQAGLVRLAGLRDHPRHDELAMRIQTLRAQTSAWHFEQALLQRAAPERAAELARLMPLRPGSGSLAPAALVDLLPWRIEQWLAGCERRLPDGRAGCVMVRAPFLPDARTQDQGIVLYLDANGDVRADFVLLRADRKAELRVLHDLRASAWPVLSPAALIAALDGDFAIRPTGTQALHLDGAVLTPGY